MSTLEVILEQGNLGGTSLLIASSQLDSVILQQDQRILNICKILVGAGSRLRPQLHKVESHLCTGSVEFRNLPFQVQATHC